MIALRKSTDAFRMDNMEEVKNRVKLLTIPGENGVEEEDQVIGYQITASNGEVYLVLVNADTKARDFALGTDFERFRKADVLVDGERAGISNLTDPKGISWTETGLRLDALTATVLRLPVQGAFVAPAVLEKPEYLLTEQDLTPQVDALSHQDLEQPIKDFIVKEKPSSEKTDELPATGEQSSGLASLAGLSLLTGLGFGMMKKGRKEE